MVPLFLEMAKYRERRSKSVESKPHNQGDRMSCTSQNIPNSFNFKYSDFSTSIKIQRTVRYSSRFWVFRFLSHQSALISLVSSYEDQTVIQPSISNMKLYGHGYDMGILYVYPAKELNLWAQRGFFMTPYGNS